MGDSQCYLHTVQKNVRTAYGPGNRHKSLYPPIYTVSM